MLKVNFRYCAETNCGCTDGWMDIQTWEKVKYPLFLIPSRGENKKYCTSKYQTYEMCPLTSWPFLNDYERILTSIWPKKHILGKQQLMFNIYMVTLIQQINLLWYRMYIHKKQSFFQSKHKKGYWPNSILITTRTVSLMTQEVNKLISACYDILSPSIDSFLFSIRKQEGF